MKECVTHHYACECREEKFKELERKFQQVVKLIERMQKFWAPTDGEWRYVDAALEKIKEGE